MVHLFVGTRILEIIGFIPKLPVLDFQKIFVG